MRHLKLLDEPDFEDELRQTLQRIQDRFNSMTDEERAAEDAKRVDLEAKVAVEKQRELFRDLAERGFPRLKLDESARAVETEATRRIDAWNPKDRCIAVLAGSTGTGKTTAAVRWVVNHGRSEARFLRVSSMVAAGRFGDEREQRLKASCLVLDDLGAEYADTKGSFLADLDELVDVYYGDGRPLIITTNLPLASFRERVGNRIADRLKESGTWMALTGSSMRGEVKP